MTTVLLVALQLYLAAMLGVSGLAKLDAPQHFVTTLRVQRLWPAWLIAPVSWGLPWLEVAVAALLITGIFPTVTALLALLLFALFLSVETVLVVTQRATDCACFGIAYRQKVDGASLIVSGILVSLAALLLWMTLYWPPLEPIWQLIVGSGMGGLGLWLAGHVWVRHHRPWQLSERR